MRPQGRPQPFRYAWEKDCPLSTRKAPHPSSTLRIAWIPDDRLSRERTHLLGRTLSLIRQTHSVLHWDELLPEATLIERVEAEKPHLILMPWYRALSASRLEGFLGLHRAQGPTLAGYFGEPIRPDELGANPGRGRVLLIDLAQPSPHEALRLVSCAADESLRSGVRGLVGSTPPHGCTWNSDARPGEQLDTFLSTPGLRQSDWARRIGQLRLLHHALWSLVYDEGPGRFGDNGVSVPRACLQLAWDSHFFVMRLSFEMAEWGTGIAATQAALGAAWPDLSVRPAQAWSLLHANADLIRLHALSDSSQIELTVALQASSPSTQAPRKIRTFWVDPIAPALIQEPLFVDTNIEPPGMAEGQRLRSFLADATRQLKELKQALLNRDAVIHELRSGGVGTASLPPPPGAEELLEAFQNRYFEAQFQMRQLQLQVDEAQRKGASLEKLEELNRQILDLSKKEKNWIEQIQRTLEEYRARRGR